MTLTDNKCIENKDKILNMLPQCQREGSVTLIDDDDKVIENKQIRDFNCSFSMAKCLSASAAQTPVVFLGNTLSVKDDCKDIHSKCKDTGNAIKFYKFCKNLLSIIKSYGKSADMLHQYAGCDLDTTPILPIAPPVLERQN